MITGVNGTGGLERLAVAANRPDNAAAIGRTEAFGAVQPQAATELSPLARDKVELSPLAGDWAASPPVDAEKVRTLKDAIIRGDYRADPMQIAAKMLALAPDPAA